MGISDSPFLPETFPRWESGFAESEFSYSESDIHSLYFGECEEIGNELSSIVYESDVSQEFATELGEQRAQFGSVIDVNGTQKIVKIRIFVSRDESYLQKNFDQTQPNDNEACLFLEDNSTDILSSRSYFIKIGKVFQQYLEHELINKDNLDELLQTAETSTDGSSGLLASFSDNEMKALITHGSLSGLSVVTPFFTLFKTIPSWTSWANDYLGDSILVASGWVKENVKFADTSWDPESKRSDGTTFTPVLVPVLLVIDPNTVKSVFEGSLRHLAESRLGYLDHLANLDTSYLPSAFQGFLRSYQNMIQKLIVVAHTFSDALIQNLSDTMSFFQGLGIRMLTVMNAFYCGLWNSLIDALMGIPDILGYMLKLMAIPAKITKDIDVLLPKLLELMDELIQAVATTDWFELINEIVTETATGLKNFLTSSAGYLSWERFAYFIGALSGLVIENTIGFLLSGGAINATSLMARLGKFGKFAQILIDIIVGVNRAVDTVSDYVFSSLFRVIAWLLSIIKKGAKEAGVLIRQLFRKISDAAVIADDVITAMLRNFGIGPDQLLRLRKAGFEVIGVSDDGLSGIIKKDC